MFLGRSTSVSATWNKEDKEGPNNLKSRDQVMRVEDKEGHNNLKSIDQVMREGDKESPNNLESRR